MGILDFFKDHRWEIIFAVVAAILVVLFWESVKKIFVSVYKMLKRILALRSFEQRYRDWLIEKYRFLNVRGIKTNAPVAIELERVFISLRTKRSSDKTTHAEIEAAMKEESGDKTSEEKEFFKEEILTRELEEYEEEKTYELKDIFNLPRKRFIIIGKPGSGKTTLLNYLALKFARKSEKELFGIEDDKLPIFVNLRDTVKEGFSLDVKEFAENYNNYMECAHTPPEHFFKKTLDEGNCIILLDGLDEVAKDEQRVKVARWVDQLATAYPRNTFIATSRPYGYETARLYNDFVELRILDFTPEQVEQFIKYWTKAVEIKAREEESDYALIQAEKEAGDLLDAIKRTPKIEILTVNPLLLTIIALVHRYRGHLPERRVELYEECCDVLLGYWDTAKGIAVELQPRQKRTILQPLAYDLHLNGLREERKEKLIELLENELPKIAVSKDKATELLQEIKERCGVLVETKLGYFGFAHQTFQEFLTARHILDNDLENFLVKKRRDKYWLEVALLYCGMKDSTNLLQKILEQKEDIFYTNLFFAGKCLAESLSVSPELRAQITQQLFDIFWNRDEFASTQQAALEVLKEIKDKNIIAKLIDKTKAKESDVRVSAADALGQIQAKEAVAPLIELLKAKESYVRRRAASALGQIQAKEAVAPLIEFLKTKESYVRWSAADAIGQIQSKEAAAPLIELLKDEESYVRGSAASALGKIQAKEAVTPLIELFKDKESYVRRRAASALGEIQAKEAVAPLIELLKDEKSYVRRRAASALGRIQAKEAVAPLIELFKDKESYVRGRTAYALGQMQAKEAVAPLIELLKDKESYVRGRAAYALGKIQAKEAVAPVIELLKDKESYVRRRAASALGEIQAKEAVPPLIELLKDEESYVRWHAAYALGQIQAKEAVAPLIELLKDEESYVRWHAAYALGEIQAKEAVAPVIQLLKHKDSHVRGGAAYALGEIGDRKAIDALRLSLDDKEYSVHTREKVRECAFKALKKISEKNGIPIYPD